MENKHVPPPGFMPPPAYGPPPPMEQQQQQQQQQPAVVIVQAPNFGPDTTLMTCPHCRASISTRVEQETSTKTHLFALLLCVIGCWPCAPCPYCMDSCLTKKHYCPSCNAYLGQYTD